MRQPTDDSWDVICCRIASEYAELPELRLTLDQACRLWALDGDLCREVLGELVAQGVLTRIGDQYACVERVSGLQRRGRILD